MNAHRCGLATLRWAFDGDSERFQRVQGDIDWGGDGGWQVVTNTVFCEKLLDECKLTGRRAHEVIAICAVGVDVKERCGENTVFVAAGRRVAGDRRDHAIVVDGDDRIWDYFGCCVQFAGKKGI